MKSSLSRSRLPAAVNYRGHRIPATGGMVFAGTLGLVLAVTTLGSWVVRGGLTDERRSLVWTLAGILAVFAAGLYDDFRPGRTRGVLAQLSLATRGTITSGVVKLVTIVGASALVSWMLGARGWRLVLAIPVLAGCANLWNLLDVRPGRCLKLFLPAIVGVGIATGGLFSSVLFWPSAAMAVVLLVPELLERSMLGDSGSNVLGFIVGVGLLLSVPTVGLAVALGAILILHVLAETVTLSRLIEATPPLRWLDGVGRRREPASGPLENSTDPGFPEG
jgi:UDP-N-acetylmuramyl pentapeptide phosphotransferase/UDP-N-acetylglucosamine-1-phosphate transferase